MNYSTKLDYDHSLYNKTIICDFDDTISNTLTKDWQNSKPNHALISKLNQLYDLGWQIIILTARGQLSCNGDYVEADEKYRKSIENWLERNNVKYSKLSFQKYLGLYYVDDKNLLNSEFENLIVDKIKNGLSGADVYRVDDKIHKTSKNIINEILWYRTVENTEIKTPKIYSYIGNSLCMEYIESDSNELDVDKILEIIDNLKKINNLNNNSFSTYIQRINDHCQYNNMFFEIIPELEKHSKHFDKHISFCHGDLTIDNIISKKNNHYLIDPIFNSEFYSSYLLDISKFLYSLNINNYNDKYNMLLSKSHDKCDIQMLKLLEITQSIRVVKYKTEKSEIINHTNKLINEYFATYYKFKEE